MHLIRQRNIKQLQNLAPEFCLAASQKITTKVIKHTKFIQSENIACYISIDNEACTWEIIKTIWKQGKNCYLPIFDIKHEQRLQFVKFEKHDELILSKSKIPEPEILLEKTISPQELDLVIVPLVGFSEDNYRIGRGAGAYDRAFEFKKQKHEAAHLLGIGYAQQQATFEARHWDIPMDEIITN